MVGERERRHQQQIAGRIEARHLRPALLQRLVGRPARHEEGARVAQTGRQRLQLERGQPAELIVDRAPPEIEADAREDAGGVQVREVIGEAAVVEIVERVVGARDDEGAPGEQRDDGEGERGAVHLRGRAGEHRAAEYRAARARGFFRGGRHIGADPKSIGCPLAAWDAPASRRGAVVQADLTGASGADMWPRLDVRWRVLHGPGAKSRGAATRLRLQGEF